MNKKSRNAQLKHKKRKEVLKERARALRLAESGGRATSAAPKAKKYELEETPVAVAEPKTKAAPKKKTEAAPETKATAKPKTAKKTETAESKPKTAKAAAKPKEEAVAEKPKKTVKKATKNADTE